MSQPNWIVPSANPNNTPSGVESVGAGTPNVTITGTPINPLVNVSNSGGVTQVEGQIGNINLNGVGMTIVGGTPTAGDVTLTAAVQNVTGTGIAAVTNTAGVFNVSVPAPTVTNITGSGIATVTSAAGVFNVSVPAAGVVAGTDVVITGGNVINANYQTSSGNANIWNGFTRTPQAINPSSSPSAFDGTVVAVGSIQYANANYPAALNTNGVFTAPFNGIYTLCIKYAGYPSGWSGTANSLAVVKRVAGVLYGIDAVSVGWFTISGLQLALSVGSLVYAVPLSAGDQMYVCGGSTSGQQNIINNYYMEITLDSRF